MLAFHSLPAMADNFPRDLERKINILPPEKMNLAAGGGKSFLNNLRRTKPSPARQRDKQGGSQSVVLMPSYGTR